MPLSEEAVQKRCRLEAAYNNIECWRNNVGACVDKTGRMIRYGLANDSKKLNEEIKSSDLIMVIPTLVTQEMVGQVVGVFGAVECKHEGWIFDASDGRAVAQARFHDIVRRAGGRAGFATSTDEMKKIVGLS